VLCALDVDLARADWDFDVYSTEPARLYILCDSWLRAVELLATSGIRSPGGRVRVRVSIDIATHRLLSTLANVPPALRNRVSSADIDKRADAYFFRETSWLEYLSRNAIPANELANLEFTLQRRHRRLVDAAAIVAVWKLAQLAETSSVDFSSGGDENASYVKEAQALPASYLREQCYQRLLEWAGEVYVGDDEEEDLRFPPYGEWWSLGPLAEHLMLRQGWFPLWDNANGNGSEGNWVGNVKPQFGNKGHQLGNMHAHIQSWFGITQPQPQPQPQPQGPQVGNVQPQFGNLQPQPQPQGPRVESMQRQFGNLESQVGNWSGWPVGGPMKILE
jgi:hypothetical protein